MNFSICKKGVQALNYFACKKDSKINKMKAIKLVYFADRYHIRKYGRPVVGDVYWAMKFGPVASSTLRVANLESDDAECFNYAKKFISHPKNDLKKEHFESRKNVEINVFSNSDIEALEASYSEFGEYDQFELAELTHIYPEWKKFSAELVSGKKKRVRMDYADFFKNPTNLRDFFSTAVTSEHLKNAKEIFEERKEAELHLA